MAEVTVTTQESLERVVITFAPDAIKKGASVCYRKLITDPDGKVSEVVSDPLPIALVKGEDRQGELTQVLGEVATNALVLIDLRDAEILALQAELQALREASIRSVAVAAAGADRLRQITETVAAS